MIDKEYCMSSYLMYRYLFNPNVSFKDNFVPQIMDLDFERSPVKNEDDLLLYLRKTVENACSDNKAALALSGGIDSAILARLMPPGSTAYTFRCVVPNTNVIDESGLASHWAELNNLQLNVIDIYWEDIVSSSDICMAHKHSPIHSIEAQIYFASKKVKEDGFTKFIFGENADIIYGGMNGLLEKDWSYSDFIDRYSYVMPYRVLKKPLIPVEPFVEFEKNGYIDGHDFINKFFRQEALGTYTNACAAAGIEFIGPYSLTYLDTPIDYTRIRSGDTKYVIRDLFKKLYPNEDLPAKIPMPRPMNVWLEHWEGPKRPEFIPHSTANMTGDQKWMVWCLERFLNKYGE